MAWLGFIIWAAVGLVFVVMGLYCFYSKRSESEPCGFWANTEMFKVEDVKSYNHAMGKLWCIYGSIFIILGIPLLAGQNSPYILISVLGAAFEAIGVLVVYMVVIEHKYRK